MGNANNYVHQVNNYPFPNNVGVHSNAINPELIDVNNSNNYNGASVNYTLPGRPVQMPFFSPFSNNDGTMPNTGYVVFVMQVDMDKILSIIQ